MYTLTWKSQTMGGFVFIVLSVTQKQRAIHPSPIVDTTTYGHMNTMYKYIN